MAPAGRLDTVLVKTVSRCNFDCSYCYVYRGPDTTWRLQPKRMGRDVLAAVRDRLVEHLVQDVHRVGVETGVGLVQQQQGWVVYHHAGQSHPLVQPA